MQNSLLVTIKCPECGGPIRYPEGAFTFKCDFCSSVLRTGAEGRDLKYVIASRLSQKETAIAVKKITISPSGNFRHLKAVKRITAIYKPFWYFKGMIYACFSAGRDNEIMSKTWAYTFQANREFVPRFFSMGISSEVLALEPYDSESFGDSGIFLPIDVTREEAEKTALEAARRTINIGEVFPVYKRDFIIGEKFFLIYYPLLAVVCAGGKQEHTFILDGVHGGMVDEEEGRLSLPEEGEKDREKYSLKLLTHRCKNCGHDLKAGDFDIIYYCRECFRLWMLKGNDYEGMKINLIESKGAKNVAYLPFWKMEIKAESKTSGMTIGKVADLSVHMKMGDMLLRSEDQDKRLMFYVPALVSRNARAVIKLAAKISSFQKNLPLVDYSEFPYESIWNASLSDEEAEEMLEPLMFAVINRFGLELRAFFDDMEITVLSKEIVWYPFEEKRGDMADHYHNYHFPKKSLDLKAY